MIKHLDDVPWFEAVRLRFDDGHVASIWEKWIEFTPRYMAFYNKWEPRAFSPYHGHQSDHTVFVVKGELIGPEGEKYPAGTHITLEWGDMFGPYEAGSEGAELYCVLTGPGRFFASDPEDHARLLAEKGAVNERVPPYPLPPFARAADQAILKQDGDESDKAPPERFPGAVNL
ncbi:hypothetical protein [uncultured Modestobacter sp.]|uniref:hypothetical protein n=1 Tax=uncultured Modestobacter sp. TaxID=380048 RepID=UPI0026371AC5|nr:hypothetical protein [uncultured Modestobacter sp.]